MNTRFLTGLFLLALLVPLNHLRVRVGLPMGHPLTLVAAVAVVGLAAWRWAHVVAGARIVLLACSPFALLVLGISLVGFIYFVLQRPREEKGATSM